MRKTAEQLVHLAEIHIPGVRRHALRTQLTRAHLVAQRITDEIREPTQRLAAFLWPQVALQERFEGLAMGLLRLRFFRFRKIAQLVPQADPADRVALRFRQRFALRAAGQTIDILATAAPTRLQILRIRDQRFQVAGRNSNARSSR